MSDPADAPPPDALDPAIAAAIVARAGGGESLAEICAGPGMPSRQEVLAWTILDPAFGERLEAARTLATEALADDLLAMSRGFGAEAPGRPPTQAELNTRDRLRAAMRQWLMSKWNPEKYGTRARAASAGPASPAPDGPSAEGGWGIEHALDRLSRLRALGVVRPAPDDPDPKPFRPRAFEICRDIAGAGGVAMPRGVFVPPFEPDIFGAVTEEEIADDAAWIAEHAEYIAEGLAGRSEEIARELARDAEIAQAARAAEAGEEAQAPEPAQALEAFEGEAAAPAEADDPDDPDAPDPPVRPPPVDPVQAHAALRRAEREAARERYDVRIHCWLASGYRYGMELPPDSDWERDLDARADKGPP